MKIIERTTHVLAAAALLGAVALAQASPAAAADRTSVRHVISTSSNSDKAASDRVEGRIKDLHAKLHITAAQASQWDAFATVMRENASTIRANLMTKAQNATAVSAVDELHNYQDLAKAHVDGLARLIPTFEALYATMSDDQKKTADAVFSHTGHHDQRSSSSK